MKTKNIFLLIFAAVFAFVFSVSSFAKGSVNEYNDYAPATSTEYPGTNGVFGTDGITSGLSDPATEYNESNEISVTVTDGLTNREPSHTAVDPATNTAAPEAAMVNNGGMTAVLIVAFITAAVLLLVFGFISNRRREQE